MTRIPDYKFTVIILSNLGNVRPPRLAQKVIDLYLAEYIKPLEEEKTQPPVIALEPSVYDAYIGKFQLETGLMIKIFCENNRLRAEIPGQPLIELSPLSETTFDMRGVNAKLFFTRDALGKAMNIFFHRRGEEVPGKRIEALDLTPNQMAEYTGNYYSDELNVTYKIVMNGSKLFIHIKRQPRIEIILHEKDTFCSDIFNGEFERDEKGMIIGFSLDTVRIKNLKFKKEET